MRKLNEDDIGRHGDAIMHIAMKYFNEQHINPLDGCVIIAYINVACIDRLRQHSIVQELTVSGQG